MCGYITDQETVQEYVDFVKYVLDEIIDDYKDDFLKEMEETGSCQFEVREYTDHLFYGDNKFYLNELEGCFGRTLLRLIHHIMYFEGLYEEFMGDHFEDVKKVVEEHPDSIFCLFEVDVIDGLIDYTYAEYEDIDTNILGSIYYESIVHVGMRLDELGFDVMEKFKHYGYEPD